MIRWKRGMFGMALFCMGLVPMQVLAARPEFAYTEEKWASLQDNKLEFDEIADLVHEYNTTVQQNELDYQDYRGKSSLKIAEEYYDSANEVAERISYPSDDDENYASQIARALSSEIQVDNLITQGDNNVDDGDIKRLGYDQAEAEIIKQAKSLMITYWNRMKSLESLKENVAQAESSYESVLIRKAAGMAVQSDEKEAEEAVTTAKASLQSAESSLEATKKSLCVLLGWKYSDEVEIGILPEPDLEAMEAIRVDADIETALNNNYSLQITARRIANARNDTVRETQQKTYENQKETVSSNVKNAYNSLMLAKASYEQAAESLKIQEKELEAAGLRLSAGTITKKAYESLKSGCTAARVSAETEKLNLLNAQLTYQWAVDGLASAS